MLAITSVHQLERKWNTEVICASNDSNEFKFAVVAPITATFISYASNDGVRSAIGQELP